VQADDVSTIFCPSPGLGRDKQGRRKEVDECGRCMVCVCAAMDVLLFSGGKAETGERASECVSGDHGVYQCIMVSCCSLHACI
jgi:hypothetical protein